MMKLVLPDPVRFPLVLDLSNPLFCGRVVWPSKRLFRTVTWSSVRPTQFRAYLSRVFLYCVNRFAGTFPAQERDLLVFKGVRGFEKLFEFLDCSRSQQIIRCSLGSARSR